MVDGSNGGSAKPSQPRTHGDESQSTAMSALSMGRRASVARTPWSPGSAYRYRNRQNASEHSGNANQRHGSRSANARITTAGNVATPDPKQNMAIVHATQAYASQSIELRRAASNVQRPAIATESVSK